MLVPLPDGPPEREGPRGQSSSVTGCASGCRQKSHQKGWARMRRLVGLSAPAEALLPALYRVEPRTEGEGGDHASAAASPPAPSWSRLWLLCSHRLPGSRARASATLSPGPELPRAVEMSHLLVILTSLPIPFIPMGFFAFAFFQRRFNGVSGEIGG